MSRRTDAWSDFWAHGVIAVVAYLLGAGASLWHILGYVIAFTCCTLVGLFLHVVVVTVREELKS